MLLRTVAAVVLALLLVRWARRPAPGTRLQLAVIVGAVPVLFSFSVTGHAAAGRGAVWAVLSDVIHLTAAAVWVGALAYIALALVFARRLLRGGAPALLPCG